MVAINAVRDQIPDERTEARVLPLWRGTGRGWSVDVLSEGDLSRLRHAVDRVLADKGVRVPSPQVRGRLRTAGADVDDEAGLVRFSPSLVAAALARVPRTFRLGARDPSADLSVDGTLAWLGAAGPAATVADLISGERRGSVSSDLADVARVVDEVFRAGVSEAGTREIDYIATTGEGEDIPFATGHFYGMTTHARGALSWRQNARLILRGTL